MKKLFYPLAILGAMAIVFTSCRTDEDPAEISVNRTTLEFPYGGGSQTLTLTASGNWTAATVDMLPADWGIRLTGHGEAATGLEITVHVDSINPYLSERAGVLRFTLVGTGNPGIFVEVELSQMGNPVGAPRITGAWVLTSWDENGQQITDLDTITRSSENDQQFYIFRFLGEPQPVIEWTGTNLVYITKQLPDFDGNPFWQAPFVVIVEEGAREGQVHRIADTAAILKYTTNMLDGDYEITLLISGQYYAAHLLFVTMDRDPGASDFNFNNDALDVIESPRFTRGTAASNAPRRITGTGTIVEVSSDGYVGNINELTRRRR